MNEQWQELKETIVELRDSDGTGTQQEVCKFLVNYMGILEKQMQEPKTGHWIMTNDYFAGAYGNIDYVECSCCHEYSLEEGNFCPNCGARMVEPQEMDRVVDEIKKVCASQPKIGKWIDDKCSVCGKGIEDLIDSREWYRNEQPNFCPFCELKLADSQESEDL